MDDAARSTEPTVVDNPRAHRFEARVGTALAIAAYERDGSTIIFTHTEVPDALQGEGIGSALARTALTSARDQGLRVVARCRFIASFIASHAEFQSLLEREA